MKKAVMKFTACAIAAGMTVTGMSSTSLAASNALAGLGSASFQKELQKMDETETQTNAPQVVTGRETSAEETAPETAGETESKAAETASETAPETSTKETKASEQTTETGTSEQASETGVAEDTTAMGASAGEEDVQAPEETAAPETEPVVDTSMSGSIAFAQCEDYINVRTEASADSEAVGKVYNNGSVTILAQVGDWYQVQSGNATGYVKAEFFATGAEADAIAEQVAYNVATVYPDALMVRSEPSEDSEPIGTVYSSDELEVVEYEGDWMKVALGNDVYGYINAYYVDYDTYYATAETLEEEQARLDQEWLDYLAESEAEQERLNQEWLAYLAQQEADQAAADAAYQAQLAADQAAADAAYQAQLAADAAAAAAAQGSGDAQSAADAAYQEYLNAQAAADEATQGADEQAVYDTAAVAQQKYQEYLNAQAAADAQAQSSVDAEAQAAAAAQAQAEAEAAAAAAAQAQAEAEAAAAAAAAQEPTYEEPTYEEPTYQEPTYEEPTYQEPVSSGLGQQIVDFALQYVGGPYVYGGTSLTGGADCSGFTQAVFANFGISIPRVAASQAGSGTPVDLGSIQAGDLLFYYGDNGIGHVTIYMGNGQVVHASSPTTGIIISDYSYRTPCCARRYW